MLNTLMTMYDFKYIIIKELTALLFLTDYEISTLGLNFFQAIFSLSQSYGHKKIDFFINNSNMHWRFFFVISTSPTPDQAVGHANIDNSTLSDSLPSPSSSPTHVQGTEEIRGDRKEKNEKAEADSSSSAPNQK